MKNKEAYNQKMKEYMRARRAAMTPEQKVEDARRKKENHDHLMATDPVYAAKRRAVAKRYQKKRYHSHQGKEYQQKWRVGIKGALFAAYGDHCVCCGENEPAFLTVDHINGDGAKERKNGARTTGIGLYLRLRNEGFPPGFQILCYNCNCAKKTGGECPHRKIVMDKLRFSLLKGGGS